MIYDHWIFALLLVKTLTLLLLGTGAILGFRIVRKWDISQSTENQLLLERKSYLVSTIIIYVLSFNVLSYWLFILTVNDHLPPLITGAMCAVGVLNANPYGWITLIFETINLALFTIWLTIHYLDRQVPEYPLTKEKFLLILFIAPVVLITYFLQVSYFLNLNPNIITTCCSITFDYLPQNVQQSSFISSLNEESILGRYYSSTIIVLVFSILALKRKPLAQTISALGSPISGVLLFTTAFSAITHHYVKYIYGLPSHHCPFDIFWKEYFFIGYLIYGFLFLATLSSILIGVTWLLQKKHNIKTHAQKFSRYTARLCIASSFLLFILLKCFEIFWKISE